MSARRKEEGIVSYVAHYEDDEGSCLENNERRMMSGMYVYMKEMARIGSMKMAWNEENDICMWPLQWRRYYKLI